MLLILAVTVIAVFAALVPISDTSTTLFTSSSTTNNETLTTVTNATNESVANSGAIDFDMSTTVVCINASNGASVPSNNVTAYDDGNIISAATDCQGINGVAGGSGLCGWDWNCTYSYSYTRDNGAVEITGNITSGTTSFFSYVPTWMVLLAVVVLIAIVALVIMIVSKLEGGSSPATKL
jgi:hypothetical protein